MSNKYFNTEVLYGNYIRFITIYCLIWYTMMFIWTLNDFYVEIENILKVLFQLNIHDFLIQITRLPNRTMLSASKAQQMTAHLISVF